MANSGEIDQEAELHKLEGSLGLSEGFIQNLANSDDWSFIIQAHAVIEAALSELILHRLAHPSLADLIYEMSIGGRFGKLAFAGALELIDAETKGFIQALSTIRNQFVHRVANAGTTFNDYFRGKTPEDINRMRQGLDLLFGREMTIQLNEVSVEGVDVFKNNTKKLISVSLGMVLVRLHILTDVVKGSAEIQRAAEQLLTNYFVAEFGNPKEKR